LAIFEVWDIVKVPFSYTERPVRQRRPALVVAAGEIEAAHGLLWQVMITSALNRGRPGDVGISNLRGAGLPAPSIVRPAKIAMMDARDAQRLGTLPAPIAKPLLSVSEAFSASRSPPRSTPRCAT
jgi:mRNA interferase MazF